MDALITGGAGFIGSHVATRLQQAGRQVAVMDNLSTGRRSNVPAGAQFIECDICSPDLGQVFCDLAPRAVVHCAAQVSVARSLADPLADLQSNIAGTVAVLNACRAAGAEVVIYASSAALYGAPVRLPVDEEHPLSPLSPYGLSKLTAESYVRLLCEQYGMRWVSLRFANVFGPLQQPSGDGAVVPAFLHAMLEGRDPAIHGDGEQTRDFVYVGDVCDAHLCALESDAQGVFNISTGQATSIKQLWRLAAAITGWQREPVQRQRRPGDIDHSVLSTAKARQQLGWQARTGLEQGLRLTAAHWRQSADMVAAARERGEVG